MPFVTEEIYAQYAQGSIVTAAYPVANDAFENAVAHRGVESLKDLIRAVRNARAEVNVAPSKAITILIKTSDKELEDFFKANENYIRRFTNPEKLEISAALQAPDMAMTSIITGAEIYLPLADLLNVDEELVRLDKELAKWQKRTRHGRQKNSATSASLPMPNQKSSKKSERSKQTTKLNLMRRRSVLPK
ncbi:valyl-tRNA synthetase [Streptococcus mitis]|uniref:valine--tRNA ligase n=1 Tax=Streptococcus mitis TaxID=28037 RepID=A0A4U9XQQ4_STRMT|nr:valyl-tRNA synthetase [Streptococcus mitis]